jgi:hypothetical protein
MMMMFVVVDLHGHRLQLGLLGLMLPTEVSSCVPLREGRA